MVRYSSLSVSQYYVKPECGVRSVPDKLCTYGLGCGDHTEDGLVCRKGKKQHAHSNGSCDGNVYFVTRVVCRILLHETVVLRVDPYFARDSHRSGTACSNYEKADSAHLLDNFDYDV